MGFQPEPRANPRRADDAALAERFFGESAALTGKLLAGLPTNRELLQQLGKHRMQRI